ncbi:sigma factor [Pedobacter jejuensis]|uniref:RNA polymerase sigma-70 region 2 domain-containing protein n=1 Tax=Pedobacter jejuensis TaxID=1268550 RepID=A0A3N0BQ00_9SPHI|nr:sigma factor [Pedobacter jejuensis]RNL51079.1 hypothetical protein D7004_15255 [Pedobacter jejuensis]
MQISLNNSQILEQSPSTFWLSANKISISKLKSKDKETFKAFYKYYAPAIYGTISRILNDKSKCDLILEKTFSQAWETISTFDESKCKMFTWLNRIAIKLTSNI